MFDHFLTAILQIILVLNVCAIVAYFVLGGLKPKTGSATDGAGIRELVHSLSARWPWRREPALQAQAADFANLRRVLYSYGDGLA